MDEVGMPHRLEATGTLGDCLRGLANMVNKR